MKDKQIIIDIDKEGNIYAETFNIEGIECIDELNKLMKEIAVLSSDEKKPEYFKKKIKNSEKVVITK